MKNLTIDHLIGMGFLLAIMVAAVLTYTGQADPTYSFGSILGAFLLWVRNRPAFADKYLGGGGSGGGGSSSPPPLLALALTVALIVTGCSAAARNIIARTLIDLAPCILLKAEEGKSPKSTIIECNVPAELADDAVKLLEAQHTAKAQYAAARRCDAGVCAVDGGADAGIDAALAGGR